jgi:thiol-disulfide isomerase/thioredoxin
LVDAFAARTNEDEGMKPTSLLGNRRGFLAAAAGAITAAGIGISCAKPSTSSTRLPQLQLSSEGDLPSLDGSTEWLNSTPLTHADLRGRVALVNFGTYTCINWLRQLPYVRAWAERYKDHGLGVILVHTPEFGFEYDVENVKRAAKDLRLGYPIAIDNDYAIWNAFSNNYWPALYFVDAMGRIRHHHFGEGEYERSERVIQHLLYEAGANDLGLELVRVDGQGAEAAADWSNLRSTEGYLGFARTMNFASSGGMVRNSARVYAAPTQLRLNQWALNGNWTFEREPVVANEPNGRIAYEFHARDLHLVMGPSADATSVRFQVRIDGRAPGAAHGVDVDDQGYGTATEQRMYQLIRQPDPIAERRFEIEFLDAGAAAYAFTFG